MSHEELMTNKIKFDEFMTPSCSCGCNSGLKHHLLDDIHPPQGQDFIFEGEVDYLINDVWDSLVSDNILQNQLVFTHLVPGGHLTTVDNQGKALKLMVMDVEKPNYLSFSWLNQEIITFELTENHQQTLISLTVWIPEVNKHTQDNLVPWVLGLKRIDANLNQQTFKPSIQEIQEIRSELNKLMVDASKSIIFEA